MFPLDFPYRILQAHATSGDWVLDPFCGRGTTNYASRLLGLPSVGLDSHPLAVAISEAKLVEARPDTIVGVAKELLAHPAPSVSVPSDEFWKLAFHADTLEQLCRLRHGLLQDSESAERKALRAILLGALHGPLTKGSPSYFSNQMPRTFSPKPRYSVTFWHARNMEPRSVDVLSVIRTRAQRYYGLTPQQSVGDIVSADSRDPEAFAAVSQRMRWVITSPPYYGMRTYLPDQWLRLWFLGGPPVVDYSNRQQLRHTSPEEFAGDLRKVWLNAGSVCRADAQMVVRFGGINDRQVDPESIIRRSLHDSGWVIQDIKPAGSAESGRRQLRHFSRIQRKAVEELDVWAVRD
jgi:hypothetical protein